LSTLDAPPSCVGADFRTNTSEFLLDLLSKTIPGHYAGRPFSNLLSRSY
jgi:hypothetical protein